MQGRRRRRRHRCPGVGCPGLAHALALEVTRLDETLAHDEAKGIGLWLVLVLRIPALLSAEHVQRPGVMLTSRPREHIWNAAAKLKWEDRGGQWAWSVGPVDLPALPDETHAVVMTLPRDRVLLPPPTFMTRALDSAMMQLSTELSLFLEAVPLTEAQWATIRALEAVWGEQRA